MAFPHLEELLEFEENIVYPRGTEISRLEHFPRNFNPFVLKQYLTEASQFPEEYQKLSSFYQEVLLPLQEKKTSVFEEVGQIMKARNPEQKMTPVERLESILLLPYTAIISSGDYVQRVTGSNFLSIIGVLSTTTAIWYGLGKIGFGAQMMGMASFLTGIYKSTVEAKEQINKLKHHQEIFVTRMKALNEKIVAEHPMIFGRGYDDLDALGKEIYCYFEAQSKI